MDAHGRRVHKRRIVIVVGAERMARKAKKNGAAKKAKSSSVKSVRQVRKPSSSAPMCGAKKTYAT